MDEAEACLELRRLVQSTKFFKILISFSRIGSCLKMGQHSIFVIIKIIKNNTRILNTLFIAEFIEIMEQYFNYWNHNNLQCNLVAQTKDLYSCDAAST